MAREKKAEKLMDILLMRDDNLVPKFYKALLDVGQLQLAELLGYAGLHTFAVLLNF